MNPTIRNAICLIEGGGARGVGVLVSPRHALTAISVISDRNKLIDARRRGKTEAPQDEIVLRFPGHRTTARIVPNCWDPGDDWALLECDEPPKVRPVPMTDTVITGTPWQTWGFPVGNNQGREYEGLVLNPAGRWLSIEAFQLECPELSAGGGAPDEGQLGAPCLVNGAVAGIVRSSVLRRAAPSPRPGRKPGGGSQEENSVYACPIPVILERCGELLPEPDPYRSIPKLPESELPARPFRGLEPYGPDRAEVFFGRGKQIAEFYKLLTSKLGTGQPIVLYCGASAVGKTSLLRAGLLPRLEVEFACCYASRVHGEGLAAALNEAVRGDWLELEAKEGKPALVVIDQAEEAYTYPSGEGDPTDEVAGLVEAVAELFGPGKRRPKGRLIIAFRKEWLAEFQEAFNAVGLRTNELFLEAMRRPAIEEVVTGLAASDRLAEAYGASLEDGVAERMIAKVVNLPDQEIAPTLQILMSQLWASAESIGGRGAQFSLDAFRSAEREGMHLIHYLRRQLGVLSMRQPEHVGSGLALDMLGRHITAHGQAQMLTRDDLRQSYEHCPPAEIDALVDDAKECGLLVDATSANGPGPRTRIAHDVLVPFVRQRINESRRPGQRASRILDSRFTRTGEVTVEEPLSELDLAIVEEGLAGTAKLQDSLVKLIETSRAQQKERQRKRRLLLGTVIGITAVSVIAAIIAWVLVALAEDARETAEEHKNAEERAKVEAQEKLDEAVATIAEARKAEEAAHKAREEAAADFAASRHLAASDERDPTRAALLAVGAIEVAPAHPRRELYLMRALDRLAWSPLFAFRLEGLRDAFFSPNLSRVMFATPNAEDPEKLDIKLAEVASRAISESPLIGVTADRFAGAISSDGKLAAAALHLNEEAEGDQVVHVWEVDKPKESYRRLVSEPDQLPHLLAFSEDARWLVGIRGSGRNRIRGNDVSARGGVFVAWDRETNKPVAYDDRPRTSVNSLPLITLGGQTWSAEVDGGDVWVFDVATGKPPTPEWMDNPVNAGSKYAVVSVAFLPVSGDLVVLSSKGRKSKVELYRWWDTEAGAPQEAREIKGDQHSANQHLSLLGAGSNRYVYLIRDNGPSPKSGLLSLGAVQRWGPDGELAAPVRELQADLMSYRLISEVPRRDPRTLLAQHLSVDGTLLGVVRRDGTVELSSTAPIGPVKTVPVAEDARRSDGAVFVPGQGFLLWSSHGEGDLRLRMVDAESGKERWTEPLELGPPGEDERWMPDSLAVGEGRLAVPLYQRKKKESVWRYRLATWDGDTATAGEVVTLDGDVADAAFDGDALLIAVQVDDRKADPPRTWKVVRFGADGGDGQVVAAREGRFIAFVDDGSAFATEEGEGIGLFVPTEDGKGRMAWSGLDSPGTTPAMDLATAALWSAEAIEFPDDAPGRATLQLGKDVTVDLDYTEGRGISLISGVAAMERMRLAAPRDIATIRRVDGALDAMRYSTRRGRASWRFQGAVPMVSPDSNTLALRVPDDKQDRDGDRIEIWDAWTGTRLVDLLWNPSPVIAMGYAADGKRLETLSKDGRIRQWFTGRRNPAPEDWFEDMGPFLIGHRLIGEGTVVPVSNEDYAKIRGRAAPRFLKAVAACDDAALFLWERVREAPLAELATDEDYTAKCR